MKSATRDALGVLALALGLRLGVLVWAAPRFPPAADGHYYHVLATRLASGLGYTWLWPDGVVTYAAHYPVGYPALLAAAYALLSASPWAAMALNASIGAAAAPAAYALASRRASRRGALLAGLLVALHPGLVFYTPALMTEGVSAALVVIGAWLAARRRGLGWALPLGALFAAATLIRPQTLLLAPIFGLLLETSARRRLAAAALTTLATLALCAPWTIRNCARMDRCVLVSANGGWNLLIGATPSAGGTFAPVADEIVPAECRSVFGEADKDVCFGRAALEQVKRAPGQWLALAPKKLHHTFDTAGGAAWYLNAANPASFGERARLVLTSVELVWQRVVLLLALGALALVDGPRRRARAIVGGAAGLLLLTPLAWLSYLGLVAQGGVLGRRLLEHPPALAATAVVASTALTHAIFFGAGRYAIVCYAAVAALSGCVLGRRDGF